MDNESKQRADEIVAQIKELVKKGNIARIYVKRGEDTVLNIPLNVGIVNFDLGSRNGQEREQGLREVLRYAVPAGVHVPELPRVPGIADHTGAPSPCGQNGGEGDGQYYDFPVFHLQCFIFPTDSDE